MSINKLSNNDATGLLQQILNSKSLSSSSKQTLSSGAAGSTGSDGKDVLEAAKALFSKNGQSLDDFDTNHDGTLSDTERDGLVAALVNLLSDPHNAQDFLKSLTSDAGDSTSNSSASLGSKSPSSPQTSATSQSTGGPSSSAQSAGGAAQSQTAGGGGTTTKASGTQTAGGAAGGVTQASEFGTDKTVDPSKNSSQLSDGYTVDDCYNDIMSLAKNDKQETGPMPDPATARQLAQGIVNGVNNYFDKSASPKDTAKALVSSAWAESKDKFDAPNGGVFQCASNRFDDYKAAHPNSSITFADMSSTANPAASIDVALWAMAHPVEGMGKPAKASTAVPADGTPSKALYFWNYNDANPAHDKKGGTELDGYMRTTDYFRSLL